MKKILHFESKIGTAQISKLGSFKTSPVVEIDIIVGRNEYHADKINDVREEKIRREKDYWWCN